MREVKSTCCYCGVGCGVIIESDGEKLLAVRGDPQHPANFGRLCTKGTTLHLSSRREGRAWFPEMRISRNAKRHRASWDEALDFVADKFAAAIRTHGPDSVAFYISGQLLTEEYYVFNKLAKGLIGTNNVDTNSRLCMSSAVAGYKCSFGADAPPACYADIDAAHSVFIAGSNTVFAHPILYQRIEEAKSRNPELKLIVVDPRRTDTAAAADLHLPIFPGTDVALFNGMLNVMRREGLVKHEYIRAHTEGFAAVEESVKDYTPQTVAEICGVPAYDIVQAAKWFAQSKATLSLYCQGLNQSCHGTDKNVALLNLHLASAQIGRAGAGPLSLTGQPNAMGGREVGGMANLLPAHRELNNPVHRAEVAKLWGVETVPEKPGKTAVEMFEAVRNGEIKALWIACTNPAQSMPDQNLVRAALAHAELVVVQEAYQHTDTTEYADVLLPAASWGEKEGTVTNSERCITRVQKAFAAPGEARGDWEIAVDFARRLGARLNKPAHLFPYQTAEEIFNEHRETTRGRDLDITGLSYALLDEKGPQQWPFPEGAKAGTERLYTDGIYPTALGRAKFVVTPYLPVAEETDMRFPLHLLTGRLRDQWHGMSRTGTIAQLFNHVEEPLLSMHPSDMLRRGLQTGDVVRIRSRRGEITVRVEASEDMHPAQVFMPMHWGGQFMKGAGVNAVTTPAFDPVSKQPELKHAAVQVEKIDLPHRIVAMQRFPALEVGTSQLLFEKLKPLLQRFDYATLGLAGRDDVVVVLRGYCIDGVAQEVLDVLDELLLLDEAGKTLRYVDARRGVEKSARMCGGVVQSVCLSGETAAQEWLKNMMVKGTATEAVRPWLLAPLSAPPPGTMNRGRVLCNCLDVSASEIQAAITDGADLAGLQMKFKCGTQCGSCVAEIKRMLPRRRQVPVNEAAA